MGQALVRCAGEDTALAVTAQVDAGDDLAPALALCDAVIDFSATQITARVAKACAEAGKVLVIGTTGHEPAEREQIAAASRSIPLVFSPNYSVCECLFNTAALVLFRTNKDSCSSSNSYDQQHNL
jgi:4-hydroxy-tetrahydrodipicolinate reductase